MSFFPDLKLPPRKYVEIPEAFRERRVQSGRKKITIQLPSVVRQPLIVSFGMGTDSTAMLALLIKMVERGIKDAVPDRIYFADVGSEKEVTNSYVAKSQAYMKAAGFPDVIVVSKAARGKTIHPTLHEKCEHLKTMPSLAYGGKSCSILYKITEMEMDTNSWLPAQQAWAAGLTCIKLIGYDGGKADMRRSTNPGDAKYTYCYPLRDAKLQRPDLVRIIEDMGWKQPMKSACWMCPATKRDELPLRYQTEPDKLARALRMEAAAMLQSALLGKKLTTKGLGRNWAWRERLETTHPEILIDLADRFGIGTQDWMAYKAFLQQQPALLPGPLTEPEVETCDGAFDDILEPLP